MTAGIVENTSSAFDAALAAGYAIECDLQLSADCKAMVFHDAYLDRLTTKIGRVDQCGSSELRKIELRHTSDRMQILPELLEQVDGKVPLIIELKSHFTRDVSLVAAALANLASYQGEFALMSFDPDMVEALAVLSPDTTRGIVADRATTTDWPGLNLARRLEMRHMAHLHRTWPHFLSYDQAALPAPASRIFRLAGKPIICWTVRSPEQAKRACKYADQITFEGYRP